MKPCALLLILAACSPSGRWSQTVDGLPLHADEVIDAVAALPECEAVRAGGEIHWVPATRCGQEGPVVVPLSGCSYLNPNRVEVVMRSNAWDGPSDKPRVSTLAHELCHVCGYNGGATNSEQDEKEADACAMRARELAGR